MEEFQDFAGIIGNKVNQGQQTSRNGEEVITNSMSQKDSFTANYEQFLSNHSKAVINI